MYEVNNGECTVTLLDLARWQGREITVMAITDATTGISIEAAGSDLITRADLTEVTLTSDGDFWVFFAGSTRWELIDGVESVDNSNGQGYRYKDGTQRCVGSLLESRSASGILQYVWTFPLEFADIDIEPWNNYPVSVNATPATTVPNVISPAACTNITTTQVSIYLDRSTSTSTAFNLDANGRWYA